MTPAGLEATKRRAKMTGRAARTVCKALGGGMPLAVGVVVAVGMALAAAGCGEEGEDKLRGRFGPGEGGPALSGTTESHSLESPAGTVIGSFEYDSVYFIAHFDIDSVDPTVHVVTNMNPALVLADLADDGLIDTLSGEDIVIFDAPIVGRFNTPCRFQAAIQARDEGYKILAAGDRKNDQGLEFHQVNLRNGNIHQRFFCAKLTGKLGAIFNSFTASAAVQSYRQVHFLLNAVSK